MRKSHTSFGYKMRLFSSLFTAFPPSTATTPRTRSWPSTTRTYSPTSSPPSTPSGSSRRPDPSTARCAWPSSATSSSVGHWGEWAKMHRSRFAGLVVGFPYFSPRQSQLAGFNEMRFFCWNAYCKQEPSSLTRRTISSARKSWKWGKCSMVYTYVDSAQRKE